MSSRTTVDFEQIIKEITIGNILIPDFQRGFVWKTIDDQKRLLASVFSRLPIGSILLLQGKQNEFKCKKIGSKEFSIIDESDDSYRKFLIDGQQRLTVLTNAFSDIIISQEKKSIISSKLSQRFFLTIRIQTFKEIDVFGLTNLMFPFSDINDAYFIGERMYSIIDTEAANQTSKFPPKFDLSSASQVLVYAEKCVNKEEGICNIPLCVINNRTFNVISEILEEIANYRETQLSTIAQKHHELKDSDEFNDFIDSLIPFDREMNIINDLTKNFPSANATIKNMKKNWISSVNSYINICVKQMNLNEINVINSERARAIDIYENLNMGGVSLTTFDLLVAKVARNDINNFQKEIERLFSEKIQLSIEHYLYSFLQHNDYSKLIDNFQFTKNDNGLSKSFIDVFMNLLSISCKEQTSSDHVVSLNDIKRETILSLDPLQVLQNYPKVVEGIKRAALFMMYDLGIRKLSDINYEHVLLNISKVLMNDNNWNDRKTFDLLKYWYWIVVFSGSYDKDQSQQMIIDMKFLSKLMLNSKELSSTYLNEKKNNIFNDHYFTKKSILLLDDTANNNFPKEVIKTLILQYILSKKPHDMLPKSDNSKIKLSSFNSSLILEAHHIIPLNSASSIQDSTKKLRDMSDYILNSPLNYTLISSESNGKISGSSLSDYYVKLDLGCFEDHLIPDYLPENYNEFRTTDTLQFTNAVKKWLGKRYDKIKVTLVQDLGKIKHDIIGE